MIAHAGRCPCAATVLVAAALALGGCRNLSGTGVAGIDLDRSMPGDIARARYTHVNAAIAGLDAALSAERVSFEGIAFDVAEDGERVSGESPDDGAAPRRLAEAGIVGPGPWRLVDADMVGGRLEYRSTRTGDHLSVTVRAPDARPRDAGSAFVVTDVFGRTSLAALARTSPSARGDGASDALAPAPAGTSTLPSVARLPAIDDSTALARLDALPAIEREREDLLGLRAMLALRSGQDGRAGTLVEQGIVRHPDSALFLVLAGALFDRASPAGGAGPTTLSAVMRQRFDARTIEESDRSVARFMRRDAGDRP